MSTNLFETYEEEWRLLTDDLYAAIARIPAVSGVERERLVKTVTEKLVEAEDAVDGMGLAAKQAHGTDHAKRYKDYKSELENLKKQFSKAQYALNPNAKNELFGGGDFEPDDVILDHKALFDGTDSKRDDSQRLLQSSDASIREATHSLFEAEQTGMQVMENLHEQRTVMERFKDRLQAINGSLDDAGRLMHSMMRRIWGNKIILGFVGFLLVGGIVAIIWLRFFPPWSDIVGTSTPPSTTTMATTAATTLSTSAPATVANNTRSPL